MIRSLTSVAALLAVLLAAQVRAQVTLPSVRLPQTPVTQLPGALGNLAPGATADLAQDLNQATPGELHRRRIRDLLRANRRVLEADPNGAPMVRAELLAYSPTDAALAAALAAGFTTLRVRTLDALGERVVVLQAPRGMATAQGLQRLRALDPQGSYDFNHLYLESGAMPRAAPPGSADSGGDSGAVGIKVGLIDGGIDLGHPVFRGVSVHRHGCGGIGVPEAHGTAVASLLIGRGAHFQGVAAGSELYAADVYCGLASGGAVDAVAEAFGWLAGSQVAVINVSLVGPRNVLLERVVRRMIGRGHLIVAAVGNDGPAAPPLYPAAYPDVIGVTAVDARRRVLTEAERGPQVKFAAPGADMSAASSPQAFVLVRGTSFAAPIVAGLLAERVQGLDRDRAGQAVAELASTAIDLGAPGVDPVYGYGLVGAGLGPEPALVRVKAE